MRYHTIELNGRELNFRLTADEMESIEKKLNVKLLDFMQDYSITATLYMLQTMWKKEDGKKASHQEAVDLFDELVDDGWALRKICEDIIWKTCVVSGLLTESDLNKALKSGEQATQN